MGWYDDWKAGKLKKDPPTTEKNTQSENIAPSQRRLRCKYCHSDDLTIVTEYHKELRLRFYRDLLKKCKQFIIVFAIIFFISQHTLGYALANFFDIFITAPFWIWVGLSITVFVLNTIIERLESQTHLRFVCHCCAHSWVCN